MMAEHHDLGLELRELRDAIEPADIDLAGRVLAGVVDPPRHRRRSLAVAAALILFAGVLVVAIAPARTAVAGWFGIGNTTVDVVDELPESPPTTSSTVPTSTIDPSVVGDHPVPAEQLTGPLVAHEQREIGGVTETILRFGDVTLSSTPVESWIVIVKSVGDPAAVSSAIITDGEPALWIEGAHLRSLSGTTELIETSTLIWVRDGVEYRLTGNVTLAEALEIAESTN